MYACTSIMYKHTTHSCTAAINTESTQIFWNCTSSCPTLPIIFGNKYRQTCNVRYFELPGCKLLPFYSGQLRCESVGDEKYNFSYVCQTIFNFLRLYMGYNRLILKRFIIAILGAFAKLRKATISFVMGGCPSVRPFARMEQLGSHWTDFHEIW